MKYKTLLETEGLFFSGKAPHNYYAFSPSPSFFEYLKSEGFFLFHTTNTGKIISLHQVVAFFKCGGKEALANGFTADGGEYNVHHLDGNTHNNNPSNLVYVPASVHANITRIQNNIRKWGKRPSRKQRIFNQGDITKVPIWNRNGKAIVRFWDWVNYVIKITVIKFSSYYRIDIDLKGLGMWLIRILKRLKVGVDPSFVPNYLLTCYSNS